MTAPRLVFLHGFTQTHHHWHGPARVIAGSLVGDHSLGFIDLPGHGLSGREQISIGAAVEELVTLGGRATWVGYSMGARFALHAALAPDSPIDRLVLIGGTPGIESDDERATRRALDDQRAAVIETDGVDSFLVDWLAMPMFARLPSDERALAHRRRNTPAGLASSLRLAGTGAQAPLWNRLGEIEIPVLLLAGELDPKFMEIGRRMVDLLPRATFTVIANAAHAAHTEQPAAVAGAISAWASM